MKDLKFTATAVGLAVLISGTLSCSSAPPAPTGSSNVPAGRLDSIRRVPHVPESVITGSSADGGCV